MPATHVVQVNRDIPLYVVNKNGIEKHAYVLHKRPGEFYVHYMDTDKRMDEWVSEDICHLEREASEPPNKRRRRNQRSPSPSSTNPGEPSEHPEIANSGPLEVILTEEEYDYQQHQKARQQKNFETIIFDTWKIKPWYWSPYPIIDMEPPESAASASNYDDYPSKQGSSRVAPGRSHIRTSDLLMGSLGKHHGVSTLWVCHLCFKYMTDGTHWELHRKECKMHRPPGRKVYQRGAHTIYEVDGAVAKLYCQNLSLFGKLFIEIKTLFFDTDNFLFYILTDGTSSEDHMLGFFSKEKYSYEGYNLACITTLPQYQRKGYGMLMIEFSYELSRRAGQVGSPERPLSDLGLRSYLAYWISTLVRFFRRVLTVMSPEVDSWSSVGNFPNMENPDEGIQWTQEALKKKVRRKSSKGFEAEVSGRSVEADKGIMPLEMIHDPIFTSQRVFETTHRPDGGAETHVKVECSLKDIASATNLRIDDAAFALNECGLLMRRLSGALGDETIIITRDLVEKVAKERSVKIMYMELSCVRL